MLVAAIYLLLHLPFLNADPDNNVSWSRGPWTDEGLYLSQIRNQIQTGHLDMNESDCFLKAPLFSTIMYPFLFIFGTKLIVARCVILLSTLLLILFLLKDNENRNAWIFALLLAFSQFYIFQYAHFAQAESIQCIFILLSLYFFIHSEKEIYTSREQNKFLFFSCLFSALSWYTKINTLFFIGIIPLALMMKFFSGLFFHQKQKRILLFKKMIRGISFTLLFLFLYLLVWYLPNKDFFKIFSQYVIQSDAGYQPGWNDFKGMLIINWRYVTNDEHLQYYFMLGRIVMALFVIVFVYALIKKKRPVFPPALIFICCWLFLEIHKFSFHYLPSRYLISTVFAISCLMGFIFQFVSTYGKKFFYVTIALTALTIIPNLSFYSKAFQNRNYEIEAMNNYLSNYNLKGKTIIGPWSPTATWKSNARSLPIWKDYFYHHDPLNRFKPDIIISELDETDSDSAYSKMQINLKEISDSSRQFDIHFWKPVVYWLKK